MTNHRMAARETTLRGCRVSQREVGQGRHTVGTRNVSVTAIRVVALPFNLSCFGVDNRLPYGHNTADSSTKFLKIALKLTPLSTEKAGKIQE